MTHPSVTEIENTKFKFENFNKSTNPSFVRGNLRDENGKRIFFEVTDVNLINTSMENRLTTMVTSNIDPIPDNASEKERELMEDRKKKSEFFLASAERNKKTVYVSTKNIAPKKEDPDDELSATFYVAKRNCNGHKTPDTESDEIHDFTKDEVIKLVSKKDGWATIEIAGQKGFFDILREKVSSLAYEHRAELGILDKSEDDISRTIKPRQYIPKDKNGEIQENKSNSMYIKMINYPKKEGNEGKTVQLTHIKTGKTFTIEELLTYNFIADICFSIDSLYIGASGMSIQVIIYSGAVLKKMKRVKRHMQQNTLDNLKKNSTLMEMYQDDSDVEEVSSKNISSVTTVNSDKDDLFNDIMGGDIVTEKVNIDDMIN